MTPSIVILTPNQLPLTDTCLKSIREHAKDPLFIQRYDHKRALAWLENMLCVLCAYYTKMKELTWWGPVTNYSSGHQ